MLTRFLRWLGVVPALTTAEQMRALFPQQSRLRWRWKQVESDWMERITRRSA